MCVTEQVAAMNEPELNHERAERNEETEMNNNDQPKEIGMAVSDQETLSRRDAQDEILIDALARGLSYEAAGELAGCSGRTVARRMAVAEFARRVSDRRGERVMATTGQLTSLSSEAVETIRGCLESESDQVRLSAAKTLLDLAVRFRNAHDLEVELAEIRQHIGMEN
jgi:hypothetical protein